MKDLFRRTPLREFGDYSASHLRAGNEYQAGFRDRPGRAAMWLLEQQLIDKIFTRLAPRRALDFATGTGRIVKALEKCLPNCELHGIDISGDMLAKARATSQRAAFHEMDGRQALDEFGQNAFDVVSAFRFFPNADPALRLKAAEQIGLLTKPGGHVVLNNHRHYWSVPYLAMRAVGNSHGRYGSPNKDIESLFLDRGFYRAHKYSLGVWPQSEFRPFLFPWSATAALERFNLRYLAKTHGLGYNTIYVFRKQT